MTPFFTLRALTAAFALCTSAATAPATAADDAPVSVVNEPAAGTDWVHVIVKLDEEPVANYRGGIRGLDATNRFATGSARLDPRAPAVTAYRAHLAARHAAFERTALGVLPDARVLYQYDVVIGGLAMRVRESEIPALRALPGVVAVYRDDGAQPATDLTPAFIGAKTAWGKLGGQDDAGEGVIVGMIDTGIGPEHPSLADPDPKGKPYTVPPGNRACAFSGGANPGAPFACNGKLIGAYRFMTAYDACTGCSHPVDDFSSARDGTGHGTHTATTAAGNGVVLASALGVARGKVSGIAPRAHVIAYRVCGSDTCYGVDSAAAVQQAILDGVDVINFSIGGGLSPYADVAELAFLDAYAAGVFVAASAGNDGPAANTTGHRGGWVTTVAASTDKKVYVSKLTLAADDGAKLKAVGASFFPAFKTPAPFILASSVGDTTCDVATPDGAFTGMVVGCRRNGTRTSRSYNVAQRGAVGMVLLDNPLLGRDGVDPDMHTVPTIHLDGPDAAAAIAFATAHANVAASFTQGKLGGTKADSIAAFSSRGGTSLTLGIAKPDLSAPGVQVLAGDTPQGALPAHRDGERFQAISGTSMASPHVAGAAALLHQLYPDWTPGQIKSALMTTALTKKVVREDGTTPFTPFDAGSGRVQLKQALNPGATFDATAQDYRDHEGDLWNVNYPSLYLPSAAPNDVTVQRTAKSVLAKDGVWALSVIGGSGLVVTVPATISIPAGGTTTFAIGVDKSGLAPGAVAHATLQLKGKSLLHLPITAVGATPLPNLVVTAASASTPVTNGGSITISRTIANTGTVDATRFQTIFYLSSDAIISGNDVLFATCDRPTGLAAGASTTCSGAVTFFVEPPATAGTYHVLIVTDSRGEVGESNETDNDFTVANTITVN